MFCCLRSCLNGSIHQTNKTVVNRVKEPEIHLDVANAGTEVILLSNYLRITGTGGALGTAPLVQSKSYFEVKIQQKGIWSIGLATRQADLDKKYGGLDKESWCLCSDNVTRHNGEEYGPVVATTNEPTKTNGDVIINGTTVPGLIGIEDINEDLLLTTGRSDGGGVEVKNPNQENNSTATTNQERTQQNPFPDEGDIVGVSFDHIELNFYFNGKKLDVPFQNVKASTVFPVIYVGNGAILDIILDNFHYPPPNGFERIMLEQSLL
ncbi:SPRY domain-containing protein 7-like [Musca vetustissima]|uniref:SPRY domain-containing protein 7-like n=1 Tax=Musca vetustissima TaxID=27455 RepID=UPI002AB6D579|nr:SPRY domain-containing protein 7-like [Musca vetustissima]